MGTSGGAADWEVKSALIPSSLLAQHARPAGAYGRKTQAKFARIVKT
jgi:hypothetical protein